MRRAALLAGSFAVCGAALAAGGHYGHLFDPDALPLGEVIGLRVVTPALQPAGTISDVLFDQASGQVKAIAVDGRPYPPDAFVSGERPGEVILQRVEALVETALSSSAGASFLPAAPTVGPPLRRASALGAPGTVTIDLRDGRVHRGP